MIAKPTHPATLAQAFSYSLVLLFLCHAAVGQHTPLSSHRWPLKCKQETVYYNISALLEGHDRIKQKFNRYTRFMHNKGWEQGYLPFSPTIAIDPTCVYDTNQCWIGMERRGERNRYIIIVFPWSRNVVYNNDSATNNFKKASQGAKACTVIVLDYLTGRKGGQTAIYYTVPPKSIPGLFGYIQNFEQYLKTLNLQKDFPYTFKFTPRKKDQTHKVWILATAHVGRTTASVGKNGPDFLLASAPADEGDDKYIELEAIDGEICCQSPPRS